jgi:hypothetical protein
MSGGDLSRVREGIADLDPVMASHQHPPPRQQSHQQPKNHQQEAHQQHCSSAETTSPNNTARGAGATYGKMEPADDFPAGLRILVVDDDPTCLAILKKNVAAVFLPSDHMWESNESTGATERRQRQV